MTVTEMTNIADKNEKIKSTKHEMRGSVEQPPDATTHIPQNSPAKHVEKEPNLMLLAPNRAKTRA